MAERRGGGRAPGGDLEAVPADTRGWEGIEDTSEFRELVAARVRFVLPATIFFLIYYFALPVLNGVATDFMKTKVIGSVNIAYLFALSQFFMAWILAFIYIRKARVFDRLSQAVVARARRGR
ncbi:MAG: DUF485 domain-containing protein [Candidatus Dormibacteraeota bacterium]|nr:DUF485 domain-containing protein [Candidatus Dormibacteraeota bacterium]